MQTKPIQLTNTNQLIQHYRNGQMMDYFDYKPFDALDQRLRDLENRTYHRDALIDILFTMNKKWDAPTATMKQIERLQDDKSVVVIGGQQAGLLTGPFYSVNKLISIVRLAKEQEQKLQRPVIPVFWIAGEDHDFEEINHIYTMKDQVMNKHRLHAEMNNKKSVSHLHMNQEKMSDWLQGAIAGLPETVYTKTLYEKISACLRASTSYVDFFARLIYTLFPDEGVILIDSGDELIRHLESSFFQELIEKQEIISTSVFETVQRLQQQGYAVPLEVELDDTHLFYHDAYNERVLLKRENGNWIGKNDEVAFTTEQLVQLAATQPERLSNNVVTRPLMQEFLFPTLAFVGGDGEISYWAALKKAFHHMEFKMPPVLPRLSFTYKTARTEKLLRNRVLQAEEVIKYGLEEVKMNWLMSQETPQIDVLFSNVMNRMEQLHAPLRTFAKEISADLEAEAMRNNQYIQENIRYLQRKVEKKLTEKYETQLQQFDELILTLQPNHGLQERIWNPLPFINEYGVDFLRELMHDEELSIQHTHYIVSL